ncbi:Murein L,D-transpeptidase YcbB/YkuD [Daejeonella rubra]|uniref:Murein L,D-transpeptidase YcbB/YkuD n=1 Tax=Daejeonella rubra TaxID=990371 RepID=A0A1G9LRT6_9SPHI|nr:L,D-transpeptidase family protein [Daejeonella rubra]SDL64497.1 Murein L,D-transpeptidase YcbB/YkuD [Daejeonella rubra]
MNFRFSAFIIVSFFMILLPFQGCGQKKQDAGKVSADSLIDRDQNVWNRSIPGSFSSQTKSRFDSLEIRDFIRQYPKFSKFEESIMTFYSHRNMAFAWFDAEGLIEHADNLTDRIRNLKSEGVNKELPYFQSLDSLIYSSDSDQFSHFQKIKLELILTAQYFAFAESVWGGIDAKFLKEIDWNLPRKKVSFEEYLDSILESPPGNFKEVKAPVNRQHDLLKNFLNQYRVQAAKGHWLEIKAGSKSFELGDSSEVIKQVKLRLFELGDLKDSKTDQIFDLDLQNAVKQFQTRHGLKDDGVIGKGTISELNVPYEQRIKQLLVNMERSRWIPVSVSTDYLVVNIPEFRLHVYSADQLVWSCNVVVGKAIHKTVIFSGDLKYIAFSPYWNVPQSIVKNELLKDMRRDKNYLQKHNMEITGYRDGLPEIRQKPGPSNSLGLVKFLFPNSYNIYLHDTPSKSLFNESARAFSHGCIRISEPFKLAQFLLRNDPSWDDTSINAAMNAGVERIISLKEKTPVFIVYFTAFVDKDGLINFRKDIYDRDERLADMIMNFQP